MDVALGIQDDILATVKARIASAILHHHQESPVTLGPVTLRQHQVGALQRLKVLLRRFGGAVLADPVGTGKTWTAIAAARDFAHVVVVCPAVLRSMWTDTMRGAGIIAPIYSMESLSRRAPDVPPHGLVIVDEAHHFRHATTKRRRTLEQLTWGQTVLLLTATPVHNRVPDLAALVALFLGSRAFDLPPASLRELIVRRREKDLGLPLPRVRPPQWLSLPSQDDILRAIVALPPPLPLADGGRAAALGTLVLLRQCCSSLAALRGALHRRAHQAVAMEAQLQQGVYPTRAEVSRWVLGSAAVQLEFGLNPDSLPRHDLLQQLGHHRAALARLMEHLRNVDDSPRVEQLEQVLAQHAGERVVCFTHSADTARAIFDAIRRRTRCALLTGAGGATLSGPLPAREILRRFAPVPVDPNDPLLMEVLVATDVLSEGVNLHGASVLIHLDLPWTVARLEQRIGRLRRLGASHNEVAHYAMEPPPASEPLTRVLRRLAHKAGFSRQALGADPIGFALPPAFASPKGVALSADDPSTELHSLVSRWLRVTTQPLDGPLAATVRGAGVSGLLAVLRRGDDTEVVAVADARVTQRPDELLKLLTAANNGVEPLHATGTSSGVQRLQRWLAERQQRERLLLDHTGLEHRRVLQIIGSFVSSRVRHERSERLLAAGRARSAVLRSSGAGAERVLGDWSDSVSRVTLTSAQLHALANQLEPRIRTSGTSSAEIVESMLVLQPA